MDLSIQKMQPPATVKGKSAAKKTAPGSSDEAVETLSHDQSVRFTHGNTGYEDRDPDENAETASQEHQRQARRKNRQLLSGEDLSELTSAAAAPHNRDRSEELLHMRAYQTTQPSKEDDHQPHFEVNI